MADIELVKISELEELITASNAAVLPASIDDQSRKISIQTLREGFLANSQLTGATTVQAPAAGDDSTRVPSTAWVQDELSSLGLSPATSTTTGTVKTNSTDANPVVYLKTEVDSLINTVSTAIIPVNRGGTNATTASGARTNLGAAASGANADITALSALASVPGVVSTFVNAVVDAVFPIGSIRLTAAGSAGSNYLLCNGSAVSRTTYSALFAVIGTVFGAGDGINTFNLPNLTGRVPIGAGGSYSLGASGGSETQALTAANNGPHTHAVPYRSTNAFAGGGGTAHFLNGTANANSDTGSSGTGTPFSIMQPYQAVGYYIRAN